MARRLPNAKTKPVPPFTYAGCTADETRALQLLQATFGKLTTLRPQDIPGDYVMDERATFSSCPECMTSLQGTWPKCRWCGWREIV